MLHNTAGGGQRYKAHPRTIMSARLPYNPAVSSMATCSPLIGQLPCSAVTSNFQVLTCALTSALASLPAGAKRRQEFARRSSWSSQGTVDAAALTAIRRPVRGSQRAVQVANLWTSVWATRTAVDRLGNSQRRGKFLIVPGARTERHLRTGCCSNYLPAKHRPYTGG